MSSKDKDKDIQTKICFKYCGIVAGYPKSYYNYNKCIQHCNSIGKSSPVPTYIYKKSFSSNGIKQ